MCLKKKRDLREFLWMMTLSIGPPVELYSAASLDSQRYASSFPSPRRHPNRLFRCPCVFPENSKKNMLEGNTLPPRIMEVGNGMSLIFVSFCLGYPP